MIAHETDKASGERCHGEDVSAKRDADFSLEEDRPKSVLTEADRNKLLFTWNQTRAEYPREACIHQLFAAQVERTPDAAALVAGPERLTYHELNAAANQVARSLRALGVGPETLVSVCLTRTPRMLIGILGVLKAGAAYVPMDPAYPKERLAFILEDTRSTVLLWEADACSFQPPRGANGIRLDLDWPEITKQSPEDFSSNAKSDNLAYVIYTSGSTGQPKGVALTHRNATAFVHWARKQFSDEELAGVLFSTSICFDLSIFEMFVPLCWGGKIILAENALALPGLPARNEVTLINTVPPAMRELVRAQGVPASVRVVNLAGEPLPTALVNKIYGETCTQKVYDLYGPTETTTYSTFALRRPNEPPTIGRPLANEQIYLLDSTRQPVAIGVAGEIYIGGEGVARGYLNRPEMTAERFLPNPFKPGDRVYKTGDLARWREDGNLEFLGRMDHQVKIRGFRIELGEIEAALLEHPKVRECAVIAKEDATGEKCLVAYVVTAEQTSPSSAELKKFLKQKLPDFMVPAAYVLLRGALPLSPNGKVDKRALPPPELEFEPSRKWKAPQTEVELKATRIWEEIFQRPRIGSQDSFYDLGGHSLLAIRLITEINRAFNVNLDVLSLHEHPTIEKLARAIERADRLPQGSKLVPIQPEGDGTPIFFFWPPFEAFRLSRLTKNQPFVVSEAPLDQGIVTASIRHDYAAFPSLEEMAAPHTELIKASRFSGKCILAGFSNGGLMAFEVAHQLQRQGTSVAAVLLFDTDMKMPEWERLKRWLIRHVDNSLRYGWGYLRQKAEERFQREQQRQVTIALARQKPAPTLNFSSEGVPWEVIDRIWIHAMKRYRTRRLAGRGIVFRAQGTDYYENQDYDGCLGWKRLFKGGLEVVTVPGDHFSMWKEPNITSLSRFWERALQKLQVNGLTLFVTGLISDPWIVALNLM